MINEPKQVEFESYVKVALSKMVDAFNSNNLSQANKIAQETIDYCKKIIIEKLYGEHSGIYNSALAIGILFRGFQDYIAIEIIRGSSNWIKDHKKIEEVWSDLWDCRERLNYTTLHFTSEVIDHMLKQLDSIEAFFLAQFGPGLYVSPEMLIKSEVCSICQKDPRSCEHITGRIYNGVRCVSIVKDCVPRNGGAIVQYPEDPRCRIWPWNVKDVNGNKQFSAPILRFFQLDDFMFEED